jgi:glycosyltransferase involved in cell wall biosynthesis
MNSMIKSMRVDVLMPVHGNALYLYESIISVLEDMQTTDKLIIILDRASTNVVSITNFYSKIDKRIQVIESTAPGISSALNEGVRASTADFLARIDCDDNILPGRLNLQRKFLKRRKNYVLVGSNYFNIDENGVRYKSTILPSRNSSIKNLLNIKNPIAHPTVMYRRDAVISSGGYNTEFDGMEDLELWSRLQQYGKFKNLNRRLIEYRSSAGQFSKNRNQIVLDQQMQKFYANQTLKFITNKNKLNLIYLMYLRKNPYLYTNLIIYFANTKFTKLQFRQIAKLSMIDSKLFIEIIKSLFLIELKKIFFKLKK